MSLMTPVASLVARRCSVPVSLPSGECTSADVRRHAVLESQADKLNAARPAQDVFEELLYPCDYLALASAWLAMHEVEDRLLSRCLRRAGPVLEPLTANALCNVL